MIIQALINDGQGRALGLGASPMAGLSRLRSPSLPLSPRVHSATGRNSPVSMLMGSPAHRSLAAYGSPRMDMGMPSGLSGTTGQM